MTKIVINARHGGFGLSDAALQLYHQLNPERLSPRGRDDPFLVRVVETLGPEAGYRFACLKVVEIPDDVEWQIDDYDGMEWVAEKHRVWA